MRDKAWHFIKITGAIFLLAASINLFLGPHQIAAGGVSGIGILLEAAIGINRAHVVLALNIVMLLLAFIFLGRKTFYNILFGSLIFPISLDIVPKIMVTEDILLSVIFGSVIFAIGVAILYKNSASSGGTTIPPFIFKKYFNLNTSIGLLVTDMIVVAVSLYVFSFEKFLYAILSIAITSIVMIYIETGFKRKTALMIISQTRTVEIITAIQEEIERGSTLIDIRGTWKNEEREMIWLVISPQEYVPVQDIINKIDPKCFMVAYNVADVHGLGFTYQPIQ